MGVVLLPVWELVHCPTPYVGILLLPVRKLVHYVLPPMRGLYLHPCGSLYTPPKVYTHNHQVLEDIELALMWAAAISKYGTLNTCEPSLNLGIRITLPRVLSLGCRPSGDCLDLHQVLQAAACHSVAEFRDFKQFPKWNKSSLSLRQP